VGTIYSFEEMKDSSEAPGTGPREYTILLTYYKKRDPKESLLT